MTTTTRHAGSEEHRSEPELHAGLGHVRSSPPDVGRLELVVRRPSLDRREVLAEAVLDLEEGLVGDDWRTRGSRSTPDGGPDPDAQLTVMNARAAALIAGDPTRWALAGDQLYVDLALGPADLPPGSLVVIGAAAIEVTAKPHRGCAKFAARFGRDALRVVNSTTGLELSLRGVNARVVTPGPVRTGDRVEVVSRPRRPGTAPAPA